MAPVHGMLPNTKHTAVVRFGACSTSIGLDPRRPCKGCFQIQHTWRSCGGGLIVWQHGSLVGWIPGCDEVHASRSKFPARLNCSCGADGTIEFKLLTLGSTGQAAMIASSRGNARVSAGSLRGIWNFGEALWQAESGAPKRQPSIRDACCGGNLASSNTRCHGRKF